MSASNIISLCIAGTVLLLTIIRDIIARLRETKKDTVEDVNENYSMREGIFKANIKLDTVCTITNEIKSDVKVISKVQTEHGERIAALEKEVEMIKKQMEV